MRKEKLKALGGASDFLLSCYRNMSITEVRKEKLTEGSGLLKVTQKVAKLRSGNSLWIV